LAPSTKRTKRPPAPVPVIDDADLDDAPVLPEQFWPVLARRQPEHGLVGALVLDVVQGLTGQKAVTLTDWLEDHDWILSDDSEPETFLWCCAQLELNAHGIRRAVMAKQTRRKP